MPPYRFVRASLLIPLVILLSLSDPQMAAATLASSGEARAAFLNVGQGDSLLLRDGQDFDVLIDGGPPSAGPAVLAYLRAQAVDDLEVMVATHADSDHVGGLIDVLDATDIPVESVLYNGYPGSTATWSNFAAAVAAESLALAPAQFPVTYTWGTLTARVLNPKPGLLNPDQNSASIVLLVQHGAVDFLLTGDIDSATEAAILADGSSVAAEILKVAHHGSQSSSSSQFLNAVAPAEAIISVGANNPYGHPAESTLMRLYASGARVWRTDQAGTITVISDGAQYTVVPTTVRLYLPLIQRAPDDIRITFIDYAPPNALDEYVLLQNMGGGLANLVGWTLCDVASNCYTFPTFSLNSGAAARVWTKAGVNTVTDLYWGRSQAVWNNTGGDTAYLRDSSGQLVYQYSYH